MSENWIRLARTFDGALWMKRAPYEAKKYKFQFTNIWFFIISGLDREFRRRSPVSPIPLDRRSKTCAASLVSKCTVERSAASLRTKAMNFLWIATALAAVTSALWFAFFGILHSELPLVLSCFPSCLATQLSSTFLSFALMVLVIIISPFTIMIKSFLQSFIVKDMINFINGLYFG